jgi:exodeoxyribonuclease V beta subunit
VAYLRRLAGLDWPPLRGFMKGFVDLVFEYRGRWFVVDYKSNHLGAGRDSYGQAALRRAMAAHHYYLQYHLYTVALHRYLSLRLGSYDYERHFGGVYYLFLRGLAPDTAPRLGVFADRPAREVVEGLSALLSGGVK